MKYTQLYHDFLAESGISLETAQLSGFRLVAPLEMLHVTGDGTWPGVSIPYPDPVSGGFTEVVRYRFLGKEGNKHKYHTPKGSKSGIYFPLNGGLPRPKLNNTAIPVYICEGEKKAIVMQDWLDSEGLQGLVIGLPGVWNYAEQAELYGKTLHPALNQIDWGKRTVYILYDNDAKPNPDVQFAAARLTVLLQVRGAMVYNVLLAIPDHIGKLGVDDFLLAGGNMRDVLEASTQPAREVEGERIPAIVNQLNGRFIFDHSTCCTIDMETGHYVKSRDLAVVYPRKVPLLRENGTHKPTYAVYVWRDNKYRVEIRGKTFDPSTRTKILPNGYYNIFDGFAARQVEDYRCRGIELWEKMLAGLCYGLEPHEAEWFIQRMAWIFQHPEQRALSAVMLRSDHQGIGKSLLLSTLCRLAGKHGRTLGDLSLNKSFNSEYEGALVIHFEEVSSGKSVESKNFIKQLITAEDIICNAKYVAPYPIKNFANIFLSSNHAAPVGINDHYDRRMFVISVPVDAPIPTTEEFTELYNFLATATGLDCVYSWFLATATETFAPGARPPTTAAKAAVVAASAPQVVQWLEACIDGEVRLLDTGWPEPVLLTDQAPGRAVLTRAGLVAAAHEYLRLTGSGARYSDRGIVEQLASRGLIEPLPRRCGGDERGRIRVGFGKLCVVYAVGRESIEWWREHGTREHAARGAQWADADLPDQGGQE